MRLIAPKGQPRKSGIGIDEVNRDLTHGYIAEHGT